MNFLVVRPGEPLPADAVATAAAREADALALPDAAPLPARNPALALYTLVDAHAAAPQSEELLACRAPDGTTAKSGPRTLACPNHPQTAGALGARIAAAAHAPVDGVILDGPDAWALALVGQAGFCDACRDALEQLLRRHYPEQYVSYDPRPGLVRDGGRGTGPFWREHRAMLWEAGLEHGAALIRRARDEARLVRGSDVAVGVALHGRSPGSVRLTERADLALFDWAAPTGEATGVGALEVLRAALDRRPLLARLPPEAAAERGRVAYAAALASATGSDLVLPAGAPAPAQAALAAHRRFWRSFRARYRPTTPLAELLVLYSPECDYWTDGRHRASVEAAAEALTALGAQYRIVLSVPRIGSEPIVLADATALPEDDAARLERRVAEGAAVVLVGGFAVADAFGRLLESPFAEPREGLNRAGAGTVFAIAPGTGTPRTPETLQNPLDQAVASLLGRGRRAASLNKARLVVKMFLDPDRKLDVHLIHRPASGGALEPLKGASLHLAGPAVSGARTGYLFTPDGPERKVALSPFGMGVQVQLPDFAGAAVLTIPR